MSVVLRYLGTVAAVILTVYLVPGIVVTGGWLAILLAALVWSVLVTIIKPVLQLIALPITILTFGIFALILNALLFYLMAALVPGFTVTSFLSAFLGALVLSVLSWLIHQIL
jgi:putative membrane protein